MTDGALLRVIIYEVFDFFLINFSCISLKIFVIVLVVIVMKITALINPLYLFYFISFYKIAPKVFASVLKLVLRTVKFSFGGDC